MSPWRAAHLERWAAAVNPTKNNDERRLFQMAMNEPTIVFSEWVPWRERGRLKSRDGQPSMGVYVWAHSQVGSIPKASPYPEPPEELIYVGETNNVNVRPLGERRHHRLLHYVETIRPRDSTLKNLWISVFHVRPFQPGNAECLAMRAFTRYVEDLVYWKYVQRWGKRPALDYKKGKDKP